MNCNSNTMPLIDTGSTTTCNNGCIPKDISVICRKIIIPLGQDILGVQGDTNSITRNFILPKVTEDGYDLTDKSFSIILQNSENEQWIESIPLENVEIAENYIKIKWNIKPKDTQLSGKLQVAIKATLDDFVWQTYVSEFVIQPSLINPGIVPIPLNLQDKVVTPRREQQIVTFDEGYDGLNSVTVEGSEDLLPENIVVNKSIFSIEGIFSQDGNATNADLVQGKIAYSNGEKLEGTLSIPKTSDAGYFFYQGARFSEDGWKDYLSLFDNLISTTYMFAYIRTTVENLDLSGLDTSKVKNMKYMFNNCYVNNLDLSKIDTESVTDMGGMFQNTQNLKILDLSSFNTRNVENMLSMFEGDTNLTDINFGENFDTSNVTNFSRMFTSVRNITSLPKFNGDKANNMNNTFNGTYSLTNFDGFVNLGKGYTEKTNHYSNYTLNLAGCTGLTHDSLVNIINNLYDLNLTYDVANGGTLYRQYLYLSSVSKGRLSDDEKAILTNKGWDLY